MIIFLAKIYTNNIELMKYCFKIATHTSFLIKKHFIMLWSRSVFFFFFVKLNLKSTFLNHYSLICFPVCGINCVCWLGIQSKCLVQNYSIFIVFFSACEQYFSFFYWQQWIISEGCVLNTTLPKKFPAHHLHVKKKSLRIVQHINIKRHNSLFSTHLRAQTSTWIGGNLMGSCQGPLVQLYNLKRVKSEVMQREEAERKRGKVGRGESSRVGGPTCGDVWNKRELMHLYYSNLCSQVQCKQCGSTNHHFNHGGLKGSSVSAVLHWTFH